MNRNACSRLKHLYVKRCEIKRLYENGPKTANECAHEYKPGSSLEKRRGSDQGKCFEYRRYTRDGKEEQTGEE